jgi:hypothetical protein
MIILRVSWNNLSPDQCGFSRHRISSIRLCSRIHITCCVIIPANSFTRPSPVESVDSRYTALVRGKHASMDASNRQIETEMCHSCILGGKILTWLLHVAIVVISVRVRKVFCQVILKGNYRVDYTWDTWWLLPKLADIMRLRKRMSNGYSMRKNFQWN